MTNVLEITKDDILKSSVMDTVIEGLIDRFYDWIFEEDTAIQRVFTNKVTSTVVNTILSNKEYREALIDKIASTFVEKYVDGCEGMADELSQKIIKGLLSDSSIKFSVRPRKCKENK